MGIGGATAVDQKLDYLNLLVTELRNQNPLDPMEQKDMAAQLAVSVFETSAKDATNVDQAFYHIANQAIQNKLS